MAALQEQLRSAHDSVSDSYSMVAQAQATCVSEVDKARAKEAASRKDARAAQEALQAEVKKIQRHLAGVTGIKDSEIERLATRVSTLEMTLKTRNGESVSLQLEVEVNLCVVYVCGCIHYVYVYRHVCICMYIFFCTFIYEYIYVYICIYTYICICVHNCVN